MSKKKKIFLAELAVLLVLFAAGIAYLYSISADQAETGKIEIEEVDIGAVPDGADVGECAVKSGSVKVKVTVKEGRMEAIEILDSKGYRGGQGENTKEIFDDMIQAQKITSNTDSEETYFTKMLRKAVEDALRAD